MSRLRLLGLLACHAVFWTWNLNFLAVILLGLPEVWIVLLEATWKGFVPWNLTAFVVLLAAIPMAAMVGGLVLRRDATKIFQLFFGVEAPLFLLCLVRIFLVRELTTGSAFALGLLGVGIAALGVELFAGHATGRAAKAIQLAAHAVLLVCGLHLGVLLGFYAVPAGVGLAGWLLTDVLWWVVSGQFALDLWSVVSSGGVLVAPFLVAWLALFLYTATLFVGTPFALVGVAVASFRRVFRHVAAELGYLGAWGVSAVAIAACVIGFVTTTRQTHADVLARLDEPADELERLDRLARSDEIRDGLMDAYLAPYRYWTDREDEHIASMYREVGFPDAVAVGAQQAWLAVARPMVYEGALTADPERAAAAYAAFFDVPLQKAERDAVAAALRTTWDQSGAEAGLLDVDEERILVESQEVRIERDGAVASVEVREVLVNLTTQPEEALYYFTLPESAAITGVWLSNDPDDLRQYPFVVAPRGAAQEVYREQVRRRVDPALLEQVGPRQYRLRAFPIPAQPWDGEAMRVHLTWSYAVVAPGDAVPMPRLLERRNVFWDERTARPTSAQPGPDGWLPDALEAAGAAHLSNGPVRPTHDVLAADVDGWRVRAERLTDGPKRIPRGRRYAVVIDGSRSMAGQQAAFADAAAQIRTLGAHSDVDVYLTGVAPARVDALDAPAWYGALTPEQMLAQLAALRGDRTYDAVLVLTDAGSYDLESPEPVVVPDAPLWFVHLGGALPPAYDDDVLEAIQASGGGAATGVDEVLARLALWEVEGKASTIADGWLWTVQPSGDAAGPAAPPAVPDPARGGALAVIAARQVVLSRSRAADMGDLAELDAVHAIAKGHAIVTPYSSMLVLVDGWQRQQLADAEARDDRFDREQETGHEVLTEPPPEVSAVPEPEEWALILLACALAAMAWARSRESGSATRLGR